MSGGHFDYSQYHISTIKETIESLIHRSRKNVKDEYGYGFEFSEETLEEFERSLVYLELAYIYAQRIDWLVSGDDGEDTFHKRLENEIKDFLGRNKLAKKIYEDNGENHD